MNLMKMFQVGAMALADMGRTHTAAHAAAGFSVEEWEVLTSAEVWSAEQRRRVRSILGEAVSVSLAMAGLPSEPLPGQYVAAVICAVVHPSNRLVAALRAPETYDAVSASGLMGETKIVPMTPEQMVSLVVAYSAGEPAVDPETGWNPEQRDEVEARDRAA